MAQGAIDHASQLQRENVYLTEPQLLIKRVIRVQRIASRLKPAPCDFSFPEKRAVDESSGVAKVADTEAAEYQRNRLALERLGQEQSGSPPGPIGFAVHESR